MLVFIEASIDDRKIQSVISQLIVETDIVPFLRIITEP